MQISHSLASTLGVVANCSVATCYAIAPVGCDQVRFFQRWLAGPSVHLPSVLIVSRLFFADCGCRAAPEFSRTDALAFSGGCVIVVLFARDCFL